MLQSSQTRNSFHIRLPQVKANNKRASLAVSRESCTACSVFLFPAWILIVYEVSPTGCRVSGVNCAWRCPLSRFATSHSPPLPRPRLVRLWFIFVFYCTCRKAIMQLALINERVANGAWSATTTIIGWLIAQTKRKCRIVWDGTVITSARVIKNERVGIELGEQLLTDFVPFPPPPFNWFVCQKRTYSQLHPHPFILCVTSFASP